MILHNQATPAQEATLAELSRETIQAVSLQFQVCQLRELANFLWDGGDTVVAET